MVKAASSKGALLSKPAKVAKEKPAAVVEKVDAPSNQVLKQIATLAEQQLIMEKEVAAAQKDVEEKSRLLRKISDELLPSAMNEAHMRSFTLDDGSEVEIKDEISLNINDELKPKLFAWLEKKGFGDLIKRVVSVPFGMNQMKDTVKLEAALKKLGFDFSTANTLHAGTAKSFVKEQLAEQDKKKRIDVPLELFGAYPYQRAAIKAPKKPK